MGEEVQRGVAITCVFRAQQGHAPYVHRVSTGWVLHAHRLFIPRAAPSDTCPYGRPEQDALQRAVLPYEERSTTAGHAEHEAQGANVAVSAPQVSLADTGEYLVHDPAFLGMAILGEDDIGDQQALLIQHHDSLAGQWSGPGATPLLEAMCGRGHMIPVQHLRHSARQPPRMARVPTGFGYTTLRGLLPR